MVTFVPLARIIFVERKRQTSGKVRITNSSLFTPLLENKTYRFSSLAYGIGQFTSLPIVIAIILSVSHLHIVQRRKQISPIQFRLPIINLEMRAM